MKSIVDDIAVTCDEIEDTHKGAVIDPSNGINYRLIALFHWQLRVFNCLWSFWLSITWSVD